MSKKNESEATAAQPEEDTVLMVNKHGEEQRVKSMHVAAWEQMGYEKVKE